MPHDVFISYSNKNKVVADAICAKLEECKIRVWIAPRDVPPGQDFAASIIHAIDQCKILVLIWSEESNKSEHILNEVNHAFSQNITVIPFRIDNVVPTESLEYYIGRTHWLDALTPPLEQHIQKLANTILPLLGQPVGMESKVPGPAEWEAGVEKEKTGTGLAGKPSPKPRTWWPYLVVLVGVVVVAVILVLNNRGFFTPAEKNLPVQSQVPVIPSTPVPTLVPTLAPTLKPTPIDVSGLLSPSPTPLVPPAPYGIEILPGYKIEHILRPALVNPNDIRVGPDGRIFIVEYEGYRILELGKDGTLSTFLELAKPGFSSLINSAGDLFVMQGDALMKISPGGERVVFARINGSGGLAGLDSQDNLFMMAGGELLRFSPDGEKAVIASDVENGSMAISPTGDTYIASGSQGRIFKVSQAGTISTLASGFRLDGFNLAFDPEGNLYQNQDYFSRVSLEDGSLSAPILKDYNSLLTGRPFTFTPSGEAIFVDPATGNAIRASIQAGTASVLVEGIGNSSALAVDASGNIFMGASNEFPVAPGRIVKIPPDGKISDYAKGFFTIRDLVLDDQGDVFVSDFDQQGEGGGRLIKILPSGLGSIIFSGHYDLVSLVYDPLTGDILAFEQNDHQLIRITPEGVSTAIPVDFGGELSGMDLAFDNAGDLIALVVFPGAGDAGSFTSRLYRISSEGQASLITNVDAPLMADHVSIGPSGEMFVVGPEEPPYSQLMKLSAEGKVTLVLKHIPNGTRSMAISNSGDIYFTCSAGLFRIFQSNPAD